MVEWHLYTHERAYHTVTGTLYVAHGVHSPQLHNERDILVWVPPHYEHLPDAHYPVLYMQDGQNLFDDHTSFAGEWHVDETLTNLAPEGLEAIVVGIPNMGRDRLGEYNPYANFMGRGRGDTYIRFITDTLKPMIDADFRTCRAAEYTGIIGSSLGGLISLYGFLQYPDVFGLCAALSPSVWLGGRNLFETIRTRSQNVGRLYIDVGTREAQSFDYHDEAVPETAASVRFRDSARRLRDALQVVGYNNLCYVEAEGAYHSEAAWAHRFPDTVRFLLG